MGKEHIELLSSKQLAIKDTVAVIELADQKEIVAIRAYREAKTSEELLNAKEDAYLQRLTQIREGRLMGKADYDAEGIKAIIGQSYEDLYIPEFEEYIVE